MKTKFYAITFSKKTILQLRKITNNDSQGAISVTKPFSLTLSLYQSLSISLAEKISFDPVQPT